MFSPPDSAVSPLTLHVPGASYLHRVAVGGRGDAFRTRLGMGSGVARSRSPRRHWLEPSVVVELVPPRRRALALAEKELLSSSRPVGGHGTVWCSRRIARKPRATERESGGASGRSGGASCQNPRPAFGTRCGGHPPGLRIDSGSEIHSKNNENQ